MHALRPFLFAHRSLAVLLVGVALLMKMAVPGGTMIDVRHTVLTVTLCADASGMEQVRHIVVPREETGGDATANPGEPGSCAFTTLAADGLSGAAPDLLAAAIAFLLALGLAPLRRLRLQRRSFQQPPLRGPPALLSA